MKKTLTQKRIADYKRLCRDSNNGRLLTANGLRLICEANNYDPKGIGQHFLEAPKRWICGRFVYAFVIYFLLKYMDV